MNTRTNNKVTTAKRSSKGIKSTKNHKKNISKITKTENHHRKKNSSKSNSKKVKKIRTSSKITVNKKKKKSNLKVFLYTVIFLILLSGSAFLTYYYNIYKNYNKFIIKGNQHSNVEEYSQAIESYKKALDYKIDNEVYIKIKKVNKLVKSKNDYNLGMKLKNQGKYKEAINTFKKVHISDELRYYHAQNEIQECKRLINNR